MTVAHKNLTGTDLHEMKGASTATAGQVPVADGAGATPFGKLTAASLTGTGNPFGGQLLHVQEYQVANQSSGSGASSPAGVNQVLNTTRTNEISGASVGSFLITLPAGTYYADGFATVASTSNSGTVPRCSAWLFNATSASLLCVSSAALFVFSQSTAAITCQVPLQFAGRFTLAGTANIGVYTACSTNSVTASAGGLGATAYTDVRIWKIA